MNKFAMVLVDVEGGIALVCLRLRIVFKRTSEGRGLGQALRGEGGG